ncbi:glutamate-1-semialdehyde 2,1-aminomutase [Vampirovibrio chlorellavorus]|uniref:glutamate-1-semialdehyde 2,1-aminomutase n=1 Tax=Vampirovibrio chlorellavorus TaxID=758823 RepID=UPI0026F12CE3|nr:glutamate-1-semialdehyde 2,1-aminomutase [Vampirovibrio chlorellavorus]
MTQPASPVNTANRTRSEAAFLEAQKVLPGGVNSPVRAFRSVGGTPVFIEKAKGAYLWDLDGNRYIDYVGTWGPAILGHAHPQVIRKIQQTAENGTSFGAPTLMETEMAQLVIDMVPSIEKVRFVSSGTEAVMSAIRLARAYTGRTKIIKFEGCYHGHSDYLLVKAGSGAATQGVPDSAGVPASTAAETLNARFNDVDSVAALFRAYPGQIAGVLIEPVAGNMGCIPPLPGFLEGLRELTLQESACLIFDEVMTGFRLAPGGAQERFGVTPDITCLGKIIGGGLPVGAYGGKLEIMGQVAPEGPMYQAGTLSGNPLAMAAGMETLKLLRQPGTYERLEALGQQLGDGLQAICQRKGIPYHLHGVGAMMTLFFAEGPIHNYQDVCRFDRERFNRFFWGMLDRGVYLAPSQFEAGFISLAHTDADIQATLEAAELAIR